MNTSSISSTFYTTQNSGFHGSYSEKILSPAKRSVSPISRKLESLNMSFPYERKVVDTSELERKVTALDEKINMNNRLANEKFKAAGDQIAKLENKIPELINALEAVDEAKLREIKEVEVKILNETATENQRCKEARQNIFKKIEEKLYNLHVDVVTEQRKRVELMENQYVQVEQRIHKLQDGIELERKIREDNNEKLIRKVAGQLEKIQTNLKVEKKIRNETENLLFRSLEDVNKKLSQQIKAERESREQSEGEMLRLMEEACSRLESHVVSKRNTKWIY